MPNIAELRKKRGITQSALAAAIGVKQGAVSQWENGKNLPRLDAAHKMAIELGCSMDDICSALLADGSAK